ncbi:MAG: hypothetical protein JW913_10270 [Chitinispirillaceae bacterium]|nr:hypothetical protein [Chitinispirillaceae bacterium]
MMQVTFEEIFQYAARCRWGRRSALFKLYLGKIEEIESEGNENVKPSFRHAGSRTGGRGTFFLQQKKVPKKCRPQLRLIELQAGGR